MTYGSLTNTTLSRTQSAEAAIAAAQIGDGATILSYTDRHAATVIRKTRCTITVQQNTATRTDKRGVSEAQDYTDTPNPEGKTVTYRVTKRGLVSSRTGCGVILGTRDEYYDFSF